jgi:hypothetical protein
VKAATADCIQYLVRRNWFCQTLLHPPQVPLAVALLLAVGEIEP